MSFNWSSKRWSRDSDKIIRAELTAAIKKLQRKKRKARKKKDD